MADKETLRQTIVTVLSSDAAQKIEVDFDGVYFTGGFYSLVIGALTYNKENTLAGRSLYKMEKTDEAEAFYRPKSVGGSNSGIFFTDYDYGLSDPFQKETLVHECFHCWRDLTGRSAPSLPNSSIRTTKLTDEAMAYLVGSLYTVRSTTKAGATPVAPSWAPGSASTNTGLNQLIDDLNSEAFRIAASMWTSKSSKVSPADVKSLKDATDAAYQAGYGANWKPLESDYNSGW